MTEEKYNASHHNQESSSTLFDVSGLETIIQTDIHDNVDPTVDSNLENIIENSVSLETLSLLENDNLIVNENTGLSVADIVLATESHIQAKNKDNI